MVFGWAGRILDVDLSNARISTRDTMTYARDHIGGRSLAAWLSFVELPPDTDAYSAENRLTVATGPLTGTLAPTAGRTVMTGISPRVYPRPWYTHSTLGGWLGPALKYAGFDAIVVQGKAGEPVYLEVQDGSARLVGAKDLWGRGARETQLVLKERLGSATQVLAIGPAGENLVRLATVQHSEDNAAGHSGFGAVWGSKHLKAIAVRGTGGVRVADPAALLDEIRSLGKYRITPNHGVIYGDEMNKRRPVCSQACTFNCHLGNYGTRSDGRVVPGWCNGGLCWMSETAFSGGEYEGGGIVIPPARNFTLHEEAELLDLANDLGLDVFFRLSFQPWFVRCQQLGIHEIRGHRLEPLDRGWFESFMRELAHRQGLGAVFADDMRRAMDELEGELPAELIRLGREMMFDFGFTAHREGRFVDEEPLPFWVISAMMHASESRDPTIGTHQSSMLLADFLLADRELSLSKFRVLSQKLFGRPDAFEPSLEHKAPVAIWNQHQHMILDSLTLCEFAFPQLMRSMASMDEWRASEDIGGDLDIDRRLLAAVTGVSLTREELDRVAERAFTVERVMLARAGRTRAVEETLAPHFKLPCRADGTWIDEAGFSRLLDEYYEARGWDSKFGWPKPELLKMLGLEMLIPELDARRQSTLA